MMSFGHVPTAHVLIDKDELLFRKFRGGSQARWKSLGAVRGAAVRCAHENERQRTPRDLWTVDGRVEAFAVAHRHHDLLLQVVGADVNGLETSGGDGGDSKADHHSEPDNFAAAPVFSC